MYFGNNRHVQASDDTTIGDWNELFEENNPLKNTNCRWKYFGKV